MKCFNLIFAALLFSSCQQPENHRDTPVEEEAIKATLVAMWDAIEKGDVERYALHVHSDFTQFGETDSLLTTGKETEIESIRQYTAVATNVHTEMVDPIVTVKGDVAWITYYWKDGGIYNGVPFSSHGKSTRIFVKENGRWLCIHGHYTLLPEASK
ncbi:MAG: nuclear transport factor 2 family protein [Cyclobacteriaceae bacterium]|jgi:ketosteroid isomerase-like protein|nr:nuclear transport factor 2 family protein [Cyclobacteriaceae bacterium]MDH4296283.1 nuclear transport factor 2 family protein [Cyclobacteriaceae bacterium]MDH5250360.1 nuclear transport factor 2 family protein [Cyclobacteriaceae bacterium]